MTFRLSSAARLATKIAGWLTSVASSASAGPSKQSRRRSKPRISPARSNSVADRGQLLVELAAHADGLRTLAGEQEGDLGHRGVVPPAIRACDARFRGLVDARAMRRGVRRICRSHRRVRGGGAPASCSTIRVARRSSAMVPATRSAFLIARAPERRGR